MLSGKPCANSCLAAPAYGTLNATGTSTFNTRTLATTSSASDEWAVAGALGGVRPFWLQLAANTNSQQPMGLR